MAENGENRGEPVQFGLGFLLFAVAVLAVVLWQPELVLGFLGICVMFIPAASMFLFFFLISRIGQPGGLNVLLIVVVSVLLVIAIATYYVVLYRGL